MGYTKLGTIGRGIDRKTGQTRGANIPLAQYSATKNGAQKSVKNTVQNVRESIYNQDKSHSMIIDSASGEVIDGNKGNKHNSSVDLSKTRGNVVVRNMPAIYGKKTWAGCPTIADVETCFVKGGAKSFVMMTPETGKKGGYRIDAGANADPEKLSKMLNKTVGKTKSGRAITLREQLAFDYQRDYDKARTQKTGKTYAYVSHERAMYEASEKRWASMKKILGDCGYTCTVTGRAKAPSKRASTKSYIEYNQAIATGERMVGLVADANRKHPQVKLNADARAKHLTLVNKKGQAEELPVTPKENARRRRAASNVENAQKRQAKIKRGNARGNGRKRKS